jgi:hypothetical protein
VRKIGEFVRRIGMLWLARVLKGFAGMLARL